MRYSIFLTISLLSILVASCGEECVVPEEPTVQSGYYDVTFAAVENGCGIASPLDPLFTRVTRDGVPIAAGTFDGEVAIMNGTLHEEGLTDPHPIHFMASTTLTTPEGGTCEEWAFEGDRDFSPDLGECSLRISQRVQVTVLSDSSFRLAREIDLWAVTTDLCATETGLAALAETGTCVSRFDETWTLRSAGDPIADCIERAGTIDSGPTALRGAVTEATTTSTTASPCEAAFTIDIGASFEDVCGTVIGIGATFFSDTLGGTVMTGETVSCDALVEASSPVRWSCEAHDHPFDWPMSIPWTLDGFRIGIDAGGTSTITFEYTTADGPTTCDADLFPR